MGKGQLISSLTSLLGPHPLPNFPCLCERAEIIEQGAEECVEDYFNQLYMSLDKILEEERKEQTVQDLRSLKPEVLRTIDGSFQDIFARKLSPSNEEYCEISELPKGPIKEEILRDFGSEILEKGLDKLCEDMKQSITEVCGTLDEELEHAVAEQQKLVDYYAQRLEKRAKIKSSEVGKQRLEEIQNEQAELVKRVEAVKQQARECINELEKSIRNLATQTDASDSENG